MKQMIETGPFKIKTSFAKLKIAFEKQLANGNKLEQQQATLALDIFKQNPALKTGFESEKIFNSYKESVDCLMSALFPKTLENNELKCALHPISKLSFYDSKRLQKVKAESLNGLELNFMTFFQKADSSFVNVLPYAVILNKYYNYHVDFSRPITISLDFKDGSKRKFRVAYNADFIDINPTDKAVEITPEILDKLLLNTDKPEIWNMYFPENSWEIEGFGILSFTDITVDKQIDTFKEHLINSYIDAPFDVFKEDIRKILGVDDLIIGALQVNETILTRGYDKNISSLLLPEEGHKDMRKMNCNHIKKHLFENNEVVVLPNLEQHDIGNPDNHLRDCLLAQGVKSVAFFPIEIDGKVASILEVGAKEKNLINDINIVKLDDILPFVYSFAKRNLAEFDNQINAIIQEECTSIHSAVKWKFEEEAYNFYQNKLSKKQAVFKEIVFENVFPLYGQIDIAGSSKARNKAIQKDLKLLLKESLSILKEVTEMQNLPFYEQLLLETEQNLLLVNETFHTNTEQIISDFFEMRLLPVLQYFSKSEHNSKQVQKFLKQLDGNNSLYLARKNYDTTVNSINQELARFLDEKQEEAQKIFPHYFQKYKTDGVEHDLYVGQSITQDQLYHESVLYNLRLWQMQIMCEMEARYYQMQKKYPINLKVASLIFAYDLPMSIRYRIDEKKFDVDGAYNVRYEMIKKRIDKAHVKSTNERLTQPHKLAVVYSNTNIEREYLGYFKFLQTKGYIGDNIEVLELEDLQGAIGMKAIRADINQHLEESEIVYSVKDLAEAE